jgi:hypothetical protein
VLHLDPRLADGRSAATALALPQPVWLVELATPDPAHESGAWSVRFAERVASPAGVGTYFLGNVAEDTRFKRIELVYTGALDALDVDVVEIEIARTTRGLARVEWRGDALPADGAPTFAAGPRASRRRDWRGPTSTSCTRTKRWARSSRCGSTACGRRRLRRRVASPRRPAAALRNASPCPASSDSPP